MSNSLNFSASANLSVNPVDFVWYRREQWLNLGLAMVANILAFVLIIWATPKHMKVYRWFLLNILFAALSVDFFFMAIQQPYPLLSITGYCTLGVLKNGGVVVSSVIGLSLICFLLGLCAVSVCVAATYRLLALFNRQHWMLQYRAAWVAIIGAHLLMTAPFQLLGGLGADQVFRDQPQIREAIYRDIVGMRDLLDADENCVFLNLDNAPLMFWALVLVIGVMTLVGIMNAAIMAIVLITLIRRRKQYSIQLYKMHKMLCISLIFQYAVPGITLYLTFFMVALAVLFRSDILSDIVFYSFHVFSLHSTLNALVMVFATRPYRNAVLRWLLKLPYLRSIIGNQNGSEGMPTVSAAPLRTELAKKREENKSKMIVTRLGNIRGDKHRKIYPITNIA